MMGMKVKLLSAAACICAVFIGAAVFIHSKQLKIEFLEQAEVNVNETVDNYQFVKRIENGTILTEKMPVDTTSVGEKNISFTVKPMFGAEKGFSCSVLVVDRESPKITFTDHLEIQAGDEIDLLKNVRVTDNSGEKITVHIEGNYDTKTAGEYKLKYVACDSSSNKAEEDFTLMVKEKEKPKDVAVFAPAQNNASAGSTPKKPAASETVTFTTSKGFEAVTKDGVTYIDGYLIANKTYSLPQTYGNGLTSETQSAFKTMAAAAKEDGLNIYISSGFRSYSHQKNLYNRYVKRDGKDKADTYSARAGHSEHQSGLAFDVNIISDAFIGTPEAIWLAGNCYKYGFILRYPQGKTKETGYQFEPWHFRYVGTELASKLYNGGDWISMEEYFGITSKYN